MSYKIAAIRAGIVLIPSYSIAFLTEQMVYVVPMLAATSFFAATVDYSSKDLRNRVDEDGSNTSDETDGDASDQTDSAPTNIE